MKETQNELNYSRIAEAIRFIRDNRKEQPRLEAVAEAVNMSPFHFQRIFKEWAGDYAEAFSAISQCRVCQAYLVRDACIAFQHGAGSGTIGYRTVA